MNLISTVLVAGYGTFTEETYTVRPYVICGICRQPWLLDPSSSKSERHSCPSLARFTSLSMSPMRSTLCLNVVCCYEFLRVCTFSERSSHRCFHRCLWRSAFVLISPMRQLCLLAVAARVDHTIASVHNSQSHIEFRISCRRGTRY